MVQHYYRNVHAVLFVYDVTCPASFGSLTSWVEECRQNSLGQDVARYPPPEIYQTHFHDSKSAGFVAAKEPDTTEYFISKGCNKDFLENASFCVLSGSLWGLRVTSETPAAPAVR